jgi:serpin B
MSIMQHQRLMHSRPLATLMTAASALILSAVVSQALAAAGDFEKSNTKELADIYNEIGLRVANEVAVAPGNMVLSPYSIGAAIAALAMRADRGREVQGSTRSDWKLRLATFERANALLRATLSRTVDPGSRLCADILKPSEAPPAPGASQVGDPSSGAAATGPPPCWASRVFPNPEIRLSRASALVSSTASEQLPIDEKAADLIPSGNVETINRWVKTRSAGKISRILDRASKSIGPNTDTVLLDAATLEARWASPFAQEDVRYGSFRQSPTTTIRVLMMSQAGQYATTDQPGYRAIALPYAVNELQLVIAIPHGPDDLIELDRRLGSGELKELFSSLRTRELTRIEIVLPRLRLQHSTSIPAPLQIFRLLEPLAAYVGHAPADLSAAVPPATAILHRAALDVIEDGTEPDEESTLTFYSPHQAPWRPVFRVDQPFLFWIVDHLTGAILFHGRVTDPH